MSRSSIQTQVFYIQSPGSFQNYTSLYSTTLYQSVYLKVISIFVYTYKYVRKQVELIKKTRTHRRKSFQESNPLLETGCDKKNSGTKYQFCFYLKINNDQLYLQSFIAKVKINVDKLRLLTQTGNSLNSNLLTVPSYTLMK